MYISARAQLLFLSRMAKGKGQKRKLAASSTSEESSQSQESTQAKYVPRFGSKRTRFDSNQVVCSTQQQDTQPPLASCMAAGECTEATQPVPIMSQQSPLETCTKVILTGLTTELRPRKVNYLFLRKIDEGRGFFFFSFFSPSIKTGRNVKR